MRLLVVMLVMLYCTTLCMGRHGKHRRHHNKDAKIPLESSESVERLMPKQVAKGHTGKDNTGTGRGFLDHMLTFQSLFKNKLQNMGSPPTPQFSGPIEETPMYKKAMANPHFAEDVQNFNSCKGKHISPNARIVQAAIKCNGDDMDYPCYKTCQFEELGIIVDEKFSISGTAKFLEEKMKGVPDKMKKEVHKAFFTCFEEGTKLMLRSPKCSKNQKIIDCLKASRAKMCDGPAKPSESSKDSKAPAEAAQEETAHE